MYTLMRIIKFALQDFFRYGWITLATVFVLAVTLVLINVVGGVHLLAQQALRAVEAKVELSIYMKREVVEGKIVEAQEVLRLVPGVTGITYTSRDAALKEFRARYANSPQTLAVLEGLDENPFPASLSVSMQNPRDYEAVLTRIAQPPFVDIVAQKDYTDYQTLVAHLERIAEVIQKGGLAVGAIFLLLSILIMINAVRMAIISHREEIRIMRLVGASNWFIRGPYVFQVLLFSVSGVLLAAAFLVPLASTARPYVEVYVQGLVTLPELTWQQGFVVGLAEAGAVILLNGIVSLLAMRRYLRV